MTVLDHALLADAGRVTGKRQERPDPEVPEKAAVIQFPLVARGCRRVYREERRDPNLEFARDEDSFVSEPRNRGGVQPLRQPLPLRPAYRPVESLGRAPSV